MARNHQPDDRDELDVGVIERVRKEEKIQEPRQYRVVLHNDDFTPIDFVISLVQAVFPIGSSVDGEPRTGTVGLPSKIAGECM